MNFVFGKISEVLADKGRYRVNFTDRDQVSQPLPRLMLNTLSNKDEAHFDVNEHVACIMDANFENGVIMGAIYDKNNVPTVGNKDKRRVTFDDGSFIEFDRSDGKLKVSCQNIELNGGANGEMINIDQITTAINNRFTAIKAAIAAGFTAQAGIDSSLGINAYNASITADQVLNKNSYKDIKVKH